MKPLLNAVFLLFAISTVAQKSSLADLLWKEAGGRIDISEDNGYEYEIIDDAKNGYLKVASTSEGCGCYSETTVAAYKDNKGDYTTLKMHWDGCGSKKTFSANKDLTEVLPEDFGLHTFLPKSNETEYQIMAAVFYLEAKIPQKGTNTLLNLSYIPFGIHMTPEEHVLNYEYKQLNEHGGSNFLYSGSLRAMFLKISDRNTLECILEQSVDAIVPKDKKIVEQLYGKNGDYSGIEELAAQLHQLKTIYEISKDVEFKSVILGWDRDKSRFYIKEKIKNDAPEMSFLEFVQQLPFLMAIC